MLKKFLDFLFEGLGSPRTWYGGPALLALMYGLYWLRTATWPTWRLHDWMTLQPEIEWLGTQRAIEWFLDLPLVFSLSVLYMCLLFVLFITLLGIIAELDLDGNRRNSKPTADGP